MFFIIIRNISNDRNDSEEEEKGKDLGVRSQNV
ncbi:hypothetical protein Aazo_4689 ['Nostoc azollae' 0708]|jgi:hypothetical protein|uniref:Uncharacterized protein n=1 Tax=Nostoc azollae (strain 0708) TaxID=551115 RepID=D7DXS3_NOSA0|nr:hypothetical protein Aazo_4689 ['Nostoc azollae' 0708]